MGEGTSSQVPGLLGAPEPFEEVRTGCVVAALTGGTEAEEHERLHFSLLIPAPPGERESLAKEGCGCFVVGFVVGKLARCHERPNAQG